MCKPRAVRAELYTNVGYGHAAWHAPILFNPGSLPRLPGCSEAAVVLPAAVRAELYTNVGYGHAGWHAPVVLGADSAYGAAALHARILVPLALSCASGVALHAGPREQCSPTTAGVHQGPCSQGYASVGRTWSGLRLLTRSLAQMRRRCAAMHMDDHGATDRPLAVKIRTSDSIALGLTSSSRRDHGVSVHAKQSQQASALCARKPESRHLTPTPSA